MDTWWWLAQHVVSTALLVAAVAALSRPLRTRPALIHALWVIVLIKFLTPPIVAWPLSLKQFVAVNATPVESRPSPSVDLSLLESMKLPSPPVENSWVAPIEPASAPVVIEEQPTPVHVPQQAVIQEPLIASWDWLTWFSSAWLIGSLIAAWIQASRIWRHQALVHEARPAPGYLTAEVRRQAASLRVRPVPVLVTPAIDSPCLSCAGRVRLLWPQSLSEPAAVERCRGVILHELAHVRRRDHWIAWLDLTAGIVWWFHPLVWLARRRMREAAEMACDALALSVLPNGRFSYAEAFLQISAHSRLFAQTPALGVSSETPAAFERRLKMILSDQVVSKLTHWSRLAVICVAVVALPAWSLGQAAAPSEAIVPNNPATAAAPPPEAAVAENTEDPTEPKTAASDNQEKLEARLQKIENALDLILKRLDGGGGRSGLNPLAAPPRTGARNKLPEELTGLDAGNRRYSIKQQDRGPVMSATDAQTQKTIWQTDLADPLAKLPESSGGAKWQITRSGDGKQLHAHASTGGPLLTIAIDSETGRILQLSVEGRGLPSPPASTPAPPTPKPPQAVPSLPAVAAPPAEVNPSQLPAVAPSPAANPTVSNTPAASARMPELDLVNLATAYIDAMGSLKLAKSRYQQMERLNAAGASAIAKTEVDAAAIQLETAQQKADLLGSVAQTALDAAKSELAHLEKLIQKGYATQSSGAATTAKVKLLEQILQQGKK